MKEKEVKNLKVKRMYFTIHYLNLADKVLHALYLSKLNNLIVDDPDNNRSEEEIKNDIHHDYVDYIYKNKEYINNPLDLLGFPDELGRGTTLKRFKVFITSETHYLIYKKYLDKEIHKEYLFSKDYHVMNELTYLKKNDKNERVFAEYQFIRVPQWLNYKEVTFSMYLTKEELRKYQHFIEEREAK